MDAIKPAQLSFLTIYNPELGDEDETIEDQVVFSYSAKSSRVRQAQRSSKISVEQQQHEENNERLRQIGLAQGMLNFAKLNSTYRGVNQL